MLRKGRQELIEPFVEDRCNIDCVSGHRLCVWIAAWVDRLGGICAQPAQTLSEPGRALCVGSYSMSEPGRALCVGICDGHKFGRMNDKELDLVAQWASFLCADKKDHTMVLLILNTLKSSKRKREDRDERQRVEQKMENTPLLANVPRGLPWQ